MKTITLDLETMNTLLAAAESHLEDLTSGLEDGTYDDDSEQEPLEEAIAKAEAALASDPPVIVVVMEGGTIDQTLSNVPSLTGARVLFIEGNKYADNLDGEQVLGRQYDDYFLYTESAIRPAFPAVIEEAVKAADARAAS